MFHIFMMQLSEYLEADDWFFFSHDYVYASEMCPLQVGCLPHVLYVNSKLCKYARCLRKANFFIYLCQ